jgi:hypothetical protein
LFQLPQRLLTLDSNLSHPNVIEMHNSPPETILQQKMHTFVSSINPGERLPITQFFFHKKFLAAA